MSATGEVIYKGSVAKQFKLSLTAFVFGALLLHRHNPGQTWSPSDMASIGFGALCVLAGFMFLLAIIRGRPRLSVDQRGIAFQSTFGTLSATWDVLGDFNIVIRRGPRGQRVNSAVAPFMARDNKGRGAETLFRIPNMFKVPLADIVADLNMRRRLSGYTGHRSYQTFEHAIGVDGFRVPWLTGLFLIGFMAVFTLELVCGVRPGTSAGTPSVATLLALGGISRPAVVSGEWYRLLTAPFLHAGIPHLLGNCVVFALGGFFLERLVGRRWMAAIFTGGALAGSLTSLALLGPSTVSVGASGAIMAMLAALFVVGFRLPPTGTRVRIWTLAARFAIPALLPLSRSGGGIAVDYGAHFGGVLFGLAIGSLLIRTWKDDDALPRFRGLALGLAAAGGLVVAFGATSLAARHATYILAASLIPRQELPVGEADQIARADALIAAYPRDPRGYMFQAIARATREDFAGAEQAMRAALPLAEADEALLGRPLTNTIRGGLALAILGQGLERDARLVARPVCEAPAAQQAASSIQKTLTEQGLCGAPGTAPAMH
jgi:rhomboid protease GluP